MDTLIDKVMVIRTSFLQDIENNQWKLSQFFMTYVTIFYVTMLRIVTNHVFLCMLKNHRTSV